MLIAIVYNKKRVQWFELMFGVLISGGMIFFAWADFQVYPNFDIVGILLVSLSVVADAFLPNFQEKVFDFGSSRVEVTFFTNILCLVAMSGAFTMTGDLPTAFSYAMANTKAFFIMTVYTFLAYIAITFHMALVKEFGGITTVLVGNTRKAITIVLSFLLFPKPMSWLYVAGGLLVFGSLIGNAYMKEMSRRNPSEKDSSLDLKSNAIDKT
jgi:adenosine 3'-phospho 5'-phosphosulfate transporter B3